MIGRRFDLPGLAEEHRPHHRRRRYSLGFDERDRLPTWARTTRDRAPAHDLDFVAVVPEAEQLGMAPVKIGDEIADIGRAREFAGAQRNFELPDLAGITALDAEIDTAFGRCAAYLVEEGLALHSKLGDDSIGLVAIKRRRGHERRAAELRRHFRKNRASRAEHRAGAGKYDSSTTQSPRNRYGIDAGSPAPADDDGVSRIDTLLDGNVLDGIDHALGREIEDRKRCLLNRHPEGTCHLVGNGVSRRVGDETHTAAEKEVRIEIAEQDRSIRHRRLPAASAIAYRPRRGAGALGAHAQQSHRIDAGDAATAGPHALDVDGWKAGEMSLIDRTKPGVAGPRDHSRAYQAHVERCAAGIGDNRRIRVFKLRKVPAGN